MSDRLLFIFDWDGTLCDSTRIIVDAIHSAAAEMHLPRLEDSRVFNIIGLGLQEALAELYPHLGQVGLKSLQEGYRRCYIDLTGEPATLFPGVEATLRRLTAAGHRVAVATSKSRAGLNRALQSIDAHEWFHGSRCADESASKPDPLMLHQLLEEFGVDSRRAVMIGDTEYDMEMARRANMDRVAVDYGAHCVSRLQPYEPLLEVSEISEILSLIDDQT